MWDLDYLLFSKLFSLLLDFHFFMASSISRDFRNFWITYALFRSIIFSLFLFNGISKPWLIDDITGFPHCRLTCSTEFIIAISLVPVPVSSFHFCCLVSLLYYSSQLEYLEDISSVIDEKYYLCVSVF